MTDQSQNHGKCRGCDFPYALTKEGRVRKHNSRIGPGECSGSREAPAGTILAPDYEKVSEKLKDKETPSAPSKETPSAPSKETPSAPSKETPSAPAKDPWTTPSATGVDVPNETVSGQPEPARDRWGRYLMWLEDGRTAMTRTTTFAKSCSDTYALSEWAQRLTTVGLTRRPDLLALAHGMDVKRDRKALNGIVEQAKEAAGQKVAANLGTAVHALTERLDAGLLALGDVPPEQKGAVGAYLNLTVTNQLASRREWIERSTCVEVGTEAGSEMVAGTLDRIYEMPNGDLVIGDLKTGSDLSYGWGEIAVQLAIYANGVNQRGLYNWTTNEWEHLEKEVRTDYAVVVHVPVDSSSKKDPEVYRVDLREGWKAAQLCATVRAWRKAKDLAQPLGAGLPPYERDEPVPEPTQPVSTDPLDAKWPGIEDAFRTAPSREALATLFDQAYAALGDRADLTERMQRLTELGRGRLEQLA